MALNKYFWLSDIHLNLLRPEELSSFFNKLVDTKVDGLFITGDISSGFEIINNLEQLAQTFTNSIFFTIGNHDTYRVYLSETKDMIANLQLKYSNLHYMTTEGVTILNQDVALIGDDGWYDGLWREPFTSWVFAWDWYWIKDFRSLFSTKDKLELMRELANEATIRVRSKLDKAFENRSLVYLLTHIPPWPATYRLKLFEKFWTPYNSSKLMATMLKDYMDNIPEKNLIVLSGHTHIRRREQITSNIELRVAEADFGSPVIQELIWIS